MRPRPAAPPAGRSPRSAARDRRRSGGAVSASRESKRSARAKMAARPARPRRDAAARGRAGPRQPGPKRRARTGAPSREELNLARFPRAPPRRFGMHGWLRRARARPPPSRRRLGVPHAAPGSGLLARASPIASRCGRRRHGGRRSSQRSGEASPLLGQPERRAALPRSSACSKCPSLTRRRAESPFSCAPAPAPPAGPPRHPREPG